MKIGWISAIDPSGYSSCARAYIKALYHNERCSIKTILTNVAYNINLRGIDKEEIDFHSSLATNNLNDLDVLVNHCVPDRMMFSFNKKSVLYTVCEMEIPDRWKNICNSCDLIMTASNFSKQKFVESGVSEEIIKVVPHCHDEKIWNPNVKKLNIKNLEEFNFLFVGDYTPRKGGDILIRSFLKAFEGRTDVTLTLKAYFSSFKKEDQEKLAKRIFQVIESTGIPESRRPKIFFYGNPISENLMPRFMNTFDALVSPHRGEGWGLTMSQMMFLGKPVISTNYSGNLDFMRPENSYLIDVEGFEPVCEEMIKINPNFSGKSWVKLNEDSLIENLKKVEKNRSESSQKGKRALIDMQQNFSSEIISNKIIDIFENYL